MSSSAEYRQNAKEMMLKALACVDDDDRQEYLRMAAAWTTLADGAERFERNSTLIPFDEPAPNPLAGESDV